jgi:hypothetical protein
MLMPGTLAKSFLAALKGYRLQVRMSRRGWCAIVHSKAVDVTRVPCHQVVRSSGAFSGYVSGSEKARLLTPGGCR